MPMSSSEDEGPSAWPQAEVQERLKPTTGKICGSYHPVRFRIRQAWRADRTTQAPPTERSRQILIHYG